MKSLPADPFALQDRMMQALIGDIWDGKGTPRLDALRATMKSTPREAGNMPGSDK